MPTRHLTHKKCESYALTLFWIHPGIQILPGYAYQKSKGRMKHVKTRIRNLYAGYDTLLVKFRLEGDSIVDMQTAPVTDYPIQETYRCSLVYSQENEGLFWTTDHGKLMWIDPSDMDNLKIAEVGTIGGTANSAGWAYNTCMFEIPQREPVIPYAQPTGATIRDSYTHLVGASERTGLSITPWNAQIGYKSFLLIAVQHPHFPSAFLWIGDFYHWESPRKLCCCVL